MADPCGFSVKLRQGGRGVGRGSARNIRRLDALPGWKSDGGTPGGCKGLAYFRKGYWPANVLGHTIAIFEYIHGCMVGRKATLLWSH